MREGKEGAMREEAGILWGEGREEGAMVRAEEGRRLTATDKIGREYFKGGGDDVVRRR